MVKKTNEESAEQSNNGFWHGLFLGVFCSLFLATVFAYTYLGVGGFRIDPNWNLPALLEKLKLELPSALRRAFQDPESIFIPYEEGAVTYDYQASPLQEASVTITVP